MQTDDPEDEIIPGITNPPDCNKLLMNSVEDPYYLLFKSIERPN